MLHISVKQIQLTYILCILSFCPSTLSSDYDYDYDYGIDDPYNLMHLLDPLNHPVYNTFDKEGPLWGRENPPEGGTAAEAIEEEPGMNNLVRLDLNNGDQCRRNIWTNTGTVCTFNSNQEVYVPYLLGKRMEEPELEIHKAKRVTLFPVCFPWVKMFDISDLITATEKEVQLEDVPQPFPHRLSSDKREEEEDPCQTWLRLNNSNATLIHTGVKDLSLLNSRVRRISHVKLRDLLSIKSEIGHIDSVLVTNSGFSGQIRSTNVTTIWKLEMQNDFVFDQSTFGYVAPKGIIYNGDEQEFTIKDSFFKKVDSEGIILASGKEILVTNVTISHLAKYGITVGAVAHTTFDNVRILQADIPCFVVEDCSNVVFDSVTVGNEAVHCFSKYVTSTVEQDLDDQFDGSNEMNLSTKESNSTSLKDVLDSCTKEGNHIECDCKGQNIIESSYHQNVPLSGENNVSITLKNCSSLSIYENSCSNMVKIIDSNITLLHIDSEMTDVNNTECLPLTVELVNCFIKLLTARSADKMWSLKLDRVKMDLMQIESVDRINVVNSSIETVYHLGLTDRLSGSSFENSHLTNFHVGHFRQPLEIVNVSIEKLSQMKFDHIGRSDLKNITIEVMEESSIIVEKGKLYIDGLKIRMTLPQSIVVKENGHILISEKEPWPLSAFHLVSAPHYDQATVNVPIPEEVESEGAKWFVFLQRHHKVEPTILKKVMFVNSSGLFDNNAQRYSEYCNEDGVEYGTWHLESDIDVECNFTTLNNQTSIDIGGPLNSFKVHRKNMLDSAFAATSAPVINIYETEFNKIYLDNIKEINIIKRNQSTTTSRENLRHLNIKHSYISGITSDLPVKDLTIISSRVEYLSSENMDNVVILESELKLIDGMYWNKFISLIVNCHIYTARNINAGQNIFMTNTTVDDVDSFGFSFGLQADHSVIEKSSFGFVKHFGIVIYGSVVIRDTKFDRLVRNSIHQFSGSLHMENVIIVEGALNSIKIENYDSLKLINVTINGRLIELSSKIGWADKSSSDDHNEINPDEGYQHTSDGTKSEQSGKNPSASINVDNFSHNSNDTEDHEQELEASKPERLEDESGEDEYGEHESGEEYLTIGWPGILIGMLIGSVLTVVGVFIFQNVRNPQVLTKGAAMGGVNMSYRWRPPSIGNTELIPEEEMSDWTVQQTHSF